MTRSRHFDQIAIALSALCIVHCLAVPVLVALLPVLAISFGSETHFHALMLWIIVPISIVGFGFGYRVHGQARTVMLGVLGMFGLTVTALWGHAQWQPVVETLVSIAASLLLGAAHWFNFRAVRRLHQHG